MIYERAINIAGGQQHDYYINHGELCGIGQKTRLDIKVNPISLAQ